ncbi:hypothetical protein JXL83_02555 [candidate division WOR-3 bacterium]|nr:hypothetical protein [candidate division WOR-3 bacterium]
MKLRHLMLFITVILSIVFSCSKTNSPENPEPGHLDNQAITDLINDEYANLLGDPSHYGTEDTISGGTFNKYDIIPIFWYRGIPYELTKDLDIDIHGDTADVSFVFSVSGPFRIFYTDSFYMDSVIKSYSDNVTRVARFERVGSITDPDRGWRLRGLSMTQVRSAGSGVIIDSVLIVCQDTTFFLDRNYFEHIHRVTDSLNEIVQIRQNDSFTIVLFSSGDTACAFLHFSWPNNHKRGILAETQHGIHRRRFALGDTSLAEIIIFTFDAIYRRTLFTDTGSYYSTGYSVPVKVLVQ